MGKEYKKYDVFLNVNSDDTSPTAFSRRTYELLASGIPVISSYNPGIINYFKDIVMISNSAEDTEKYLAILLENKDLRDKLSLFGQRKVFLNHTFEQIFNTILDTIEYKKYKKVNKGVSIISYVDNGLLNNTINNYLSQESSEKELILVANSEYLDSSNLENLLRKRKDIKILRVPKSTSIGKCLNLATEKSNYEYISIFDSRSYYGPNYITDLINTFKYTDGYISGKKLYIDMLARTIS